MATNPSTKHEVEIVNTPVNVLILAAGLGTRMKSEQAKVLHKLGSRPLIAHVLRTAAALNPENIFVVVGHQANKVEAAARTAFSDPAMAERLHFVVQAMLSSRARPAWRGRVPVSPTPSG